MVSLENREQESKKRQRKEEEEAVEEEEKEGESATQGTINKLFMKRGKTEPSQKCACFKNATPVRLESLSRTAYCSLGQGLGREEEHLM